MSFILRKVKRANWVADPAGDPARKQRALDDFRRSQGDTDGLSVYEISSEEERDLVTAAFACSTGRADTMDFLEVAREEVEKYGAITVTEGGMPVGAVNGLHRSLEWDATTLAAFASALFDASAAPLRRTKAEVRACLARLELDAVDGEKAKALVRSAREKT